MSISRGYEVPPTQQHDRDGGHFFGGVEQQQKPLSSFQIGKFPNGNYTEIPKTTSPYPSQPYTKKRKPACCERWFSKLLWHATLRHWTWTFLSDGSCITSRPSEGTGNDGFRSTGTTWKIVGGEVVGSPKWRGEETWLGVGWMVSFSVGVDIYFWISYAHEVYTSEFTPWKKMVQKDDPFLLGWQNFQGWAVELPGGGCCVLEHWERTRSLMKFFGRNKFPAKKTMLPVDQCHLKAEWLKTPILSRMTRIGNSQTQLRGCFFSFEAFKPAICSPRNGWIITDRINNMTSLRNECTWQFTSTFRVHRLEPLGMVSCDFLWQAFQEASLGRYASALDMIPPSCLQERAVAWSCSWCADASVFFQVEEWWIGWCLSVGWLEDGGSTTKLQLSCPKSPPQTSRLCWGSLCEHARRALCNFRFGVGVGIFCCK